MGFDLAGYGQQTAIWASLLAEQGHDVAISAFYGLNGAMLSWNGVKVYPGGAHPYGNDVLLSHAADHFGGSLDDGLIVTLIDAWVLDGPSLSRANAACWTPVDHEPVPPAVAQQIETAQATPIAMSRHGERCLRDAGLDPLYVPHGIDTVLFAPADRAEARKRLNLPESAFIVGMVSANKGYPTRKGFAQAIPAFARFLQQHDDAFLYLHAEPSPMYGGMDLPALVAAHGIPGERVAYVERYRNMLGLPPEVMRAVYNALDVLLNPAYGEGFGIPIVEAQACGTPVIATGWTAMGELAEVGWQVPGEKVFTDQRSFQMVPSVEAITDALTDAYARAGRMRDRAREFALAYDARRVLVQHWQPALERLEALMNRPELPAVVDLPEPVAS